jgi:hypothetical protein
LARFLANKKRKLARTPVSVNYQFLISANSEQL